MRRIGPLVDQYPEPRVELHPQLAAQLEINDEDWVVVESRRGTCTLRAQVVRTIRPDTVFVPYHWAGVKSINQVTIAAHPDLEDSGIQKSARSGFAKRLRLLATQPNSNRSNSELPCRSLNTTSSSSIRAAASAARPVCMPAVSAIHTVATR